MKKIIILITVFALICSFYSCKLFEKTSNERTVNKSYTFLVTGIDDAAENTDVIFLLGVDTADKALSVIQIPRDTFMAHGFLQNKINQYYSSVRSSGKSEYEANEAFTGLLSESLGVTIDGFIGVTLSSFRDIVDILGGLSVEIPKDIVFYDEDGNLEYTLNKGKNILDGETAERFVRFRKTYVMGDLGRIDAQKLFLASLFKSVIKNSTPADILRVINAVKDKLITNIEIDTVISMFSIFLDRDGITQSFVTLPGEACEGDTGLSYYCLNKYGAEKVLSKYLDKNGVFDKNGIFLNKKSIKFENIYYDKNMQYQEYTDETIDKMHILGS